MDIEARDASMELEDDSAAQTDMDEDGNVKIKIHHHHSGDKRLFSLYGHNRNATSNGWLPVLPNFEMTHEGSLRVDIGVGIGKWGSGYGSFGARVTQVNTSERIHNERMYKTFTC